ncbi:SDR family oxidoreductase [Streptomyces sp. NPDC048595]|uniref:SDR family oxidoreductase n=1 Tax=Streptomyces sp. NPDC048595 TaxID=3365576 RepID=UPI003723C859
MSALLTGATGFLGCRILRELLLDGDDGPLVVLGRGSPEELRVRVEAAVTWLAGPPLPESALARLRYVTGDVTQPGLGLAADERARVTDGLTRVWHSAAALNLVDSPAPLHRTNVIGTRHVLELAEQAPNAQLLHISTAYIAGRRRTGHILEDDLREDEGFQTPYEESKYTAERLVHAWARRTGRPAVILRPSLLVTDRPIPTGLPRQPLDRLPQVLDPLLAASPARHNGEPIRARIQADPYGELNLLQAEYAARAMVRVAARRCDGVAVWTLHVTHPVNTPCSEVAAALAIRYPGVVPTLTSALPAPTPFEALIKRSADELLGYCAQRRTYDRTHLLEAVGDLPDPDPITHAYLVRALGGIDVLEPTRLAGKVRN